MESSSFPRHSLPIPTLGLGLAALGRPGYINLQHADDLAHNYDVAAMESRTHTMLDHAYAQGIRYFDAARSYGKAEDFLCTWLEKRQFSAGDIVIGSKWGYTYTADWQIQATQHEVKDHSLAVLDRQWPLSQRLHPHLQLYQIHSATFASGVLDNVAVLNRLSELKAHQVLIGLSTSGPKQAEVIARAMEVKIDGKNLFDSVQSTFNLLAADVGNQLQVARDAGLIVIAKETLANGRLTRRNNSSSFQTAKRKLQNLAVAKGVTLETLALAFVLRQRFVSVALSGAATPAQLSANVKALDLHLEEQELEGLKDLQMAEPTYWEERSRLAWN